jgi:hypothetical protein
LNPAHDFGKGSFKLVRCHIAPAYYVEIAAVLMLQPIWMKITAPRDDLAT